MKKSDGTGVVQVFVLLWSCPLRDSPTYIMQSYMPCTLVGSVKQLEVRFLSGPSVRSALFLNRTLESCRRQTASADKGAEPIEQLTGEDSLDRSLTGHRRLCRSLV